MAALTICSNFGSQESKIYHCFPTYLTWSNGIGEGNDTSLQYSCLENPMDGGAWWAAVHGVAGSWTRLSDFTFTFHFHALEKEIATHSSVLAWRTPGMGEPGGLLSLGSNRVGHDWSDLAAAAAAAMGPDAMIFIFGMLRFKPAFSLSSFTFIKRLVSSSLLSAIINFHNGLAKYPSPTCFTDDENSCKSI